MGAVSHPPPVGMQLRPVKASASQGGPGGAGPRGTHCSAPGASLQVGGASLGSRPDLSFRPETRGKGEGLLS